MLRVRLEKAAVDNGFDLNRGVEDGWMAFATSRSSLRIWLGAVGDDLLLLGVSDARVLHELGGIAWISPLPTSRPRPAPVGQSGPILAMSPG